MFQWIVVLHPKYVILNTFIWAAVSLFACSWNIHLRVGMRWRVEEVRSGKGQFNCGDKRCSRGDNLTDWEGRYLQFRILYGILSENRRPRSELQVTARTWIITFFFCLGVLSVAHATAWSIKHQIKGHTDAFTCFTMPPEILICWWRNFWGILLD